MLTVAVLGPVELRRDGVPLSVPSGRTTEVLIRLALEAGRPVRVERLIDDLWAGQAVGVARNTLQVKVSKLRRVLGDPALVAGGPAGYTLAVDPAAVDALEALRLAELPRPDGSGLALFRGDEILPGAGDGDWLGPWRSRLADARMRLTEGAFAARLDAGAAGEAIGELETLVAAHPLREGLWRLLITALYRDGRQGAALDAYRRARERLADELGVDPGPELRELEHRILVQDAALAPPPGNLPALTARLIGRDASLAELTGLLAADRLVTVVGPAGVGKTRLAIEAARLGGGSFGGGSAGGGWLVRLESAGSIWQAVGEAFGMSEATEPMVLDRLRGLRTLLLLDNCEHLVDRLAPVVERVLAAAPGVTVLATSQVPLGLAGETPYALEPLTPDDAATLFRSLAARHRRGAADAEVAAVCRSLDGLPLAIELAAARTKALSVPEIARRLDDRFTLLNDPNSRLPARRRTLRAAIDWSYELLFPDDQRGLWALASFAGGAPLAAAEQVLGALEVPGSAALDVLDRLVDRSLATAEEDRFRLLDSVRAYGLDRLREAGLADVAAAAHAAWYAAAASSAAAGLRGAEQARHLAFVRAERADIDAAVGWATVHDPGMALRIVNGFGWAWIFLGAGKDAARRSREVLAAAGPSAAPADRADALLFAAWFEASGGDLDRAFADVRAAREIAPLPRTQLFQAFLHSQQGRPAEALTSLASFVSSQAGASSDGGAASQGVPSQGVPSPGAAFPGAAFPGAAFPGAAFPGAAFPGAAFPGAAFPGVASQGAASQGVDRWEAGAGRLLEAWATTGLGDFGRARAACDAALSRLGPLGDAWALSHAEALLGGLAQAEHRFADAVAHLTRAAEAAHRLGFAAAESLHLANLGRAQQQAGDFAGALSTLERAAGTAQTVGDLRTVALAGTRRARVLRALGRLDECRAQLRQARHWYETAGGGDGDLLSAHLVAAVDDDGPGLEAVLAAARAAGDHEVELLTLDALARVLSSAALRAAADALHPAVAHLVSPADRVDLPA